MFWLLVLREVFRRGWLAVRFAGWGGCYGLPAGLLAGAVAAGLFGLGDGLLTGDPVGSAAAGLQMATSWGAIGALYVGGLAGAIGGAIGGADRHAPAAALVGAVIGGGVNLFHAGGGPPQATAGVAAVLLAAGAAAGATGGWLGGRGIRPLPREL
jgi:hypothetical protein